VTAEDRTEARGPLSFSGPNQAFAEDLARKYEAHPDRVPPEDRALWSRWEARAVTPSAAQALPADAIGLVCEILDYIRSVRRNGYREAQAFGIDTPKRASETLPAAWDTVDLDLVNRLLPVPVAGRSVTDAIRRLEATYHGHLTLEADHLRQPAEAEWWWRQLEAPETALTADESRALLARLTDVEQFEQFMHAKYPGQKRFSVEGLDMLVPVLDQWIREAGRAGQSTVMIGMAHRGRLNVLVHVLEKPYADLLQEMQMVTSRTDEPIHVPAGWTGDAKYHLGWRRLSADGSQTPDVILLNNPSHLEFINPVVEGAARALEDDCGQAGLPDWHGERVLPILVHGDAAFMGEGVVAETLNLAELPHYRTGGTLHLMLDNGLGFTTEPSAGRSTPYSGDLARGFDIPILHAAADDPPACLRAAAMAQRYREVFGRDVMLILHGYRRYGHNEGDDPGFTQPLLYEHLKNHAPVRELWAHRLIRDGVLREDGAQALVAESRRRLDAALAEAEAAPLAPRPAGIGKKRTSKPSGVLSAPVLKDIALELWTPPSGFTPYSRLKRLLERWRDALEEDGSVDWGTAESLAFATLLREGIAVRFTGQDTERGTFSQRHAVWHDGQRGQVHVPLARLTGARASFLVANSPLSESAAVGFEYGYDAFSEDTLVLWEAQFGDFANSAQVMIDQFLAAGQAKWDQASGLVLLLPHGYDGQGPEHSSARLERFLELYADTNWRVTYPTTAAQYFHLLREHAHSESPCPLIVLTGKSLFRHRAARATLDELAEGRFQPVLVKYEPADPTRVTTLVLGTGKILVDLLENGASSDQHAVAALEQVCPWPRDHLLQLQRRYPHLQQITFVQEEPANMGAWRYAEEEIRKTFSGIALRYVGRPASGTPAEGFFPLHHARQTAILQAVWDTVPVSSLH
jgi:2-oxoglutarate dehydrogenase E1 component